MAIDLANTKITISGDSKVGLVRNGEFWGCWKAATCTAAVPSGGLHLGAMGLLLVSVVIVGHCS